MTSAKLTKIHPILQLIFQGPCLAACPVWPQTQYFSVILLVYLTVGSLAVHLRTVQRRIFERIMKPFKECNHRNKEGTVGCFYDTVDCERECVIGNTWNGPAWFRREKLGTKPSARCSSSVTPILVY